MSSSSLSSQIPFGVCLICKKQMQVEVEDLSTKQCPNSGSSSSSPPNIISVEESCVVLFQQVLDLPSHIYTQIKCKINSSLNLAKFCKSCLTRLTIVRDLSQELARIESLLLRQKREIELHFGNDEFDDSSHLSDPSSGNLRQEFKELQKAIFNGLKSRNNLVVRDNVKKRKLQTFPPSVVAHAHARSAFFSGSRQGLARKIRNSALRLVTQNVSSPTSRLRPRSLSTPVLSGPKIGKWWRIRRARSMSADTKFTTSVATGTWTGTGTMNRPNAQDSDANVSGILGEPLSKNGNGNCRSPPELTIVEPEWEDQSDAGITLELDAQVAPQYFCCGVCATIFEDYQSLQRHDPERCQGNATTHPRGYIYIDPNQIPATKAGAMPPGIAAQNLRQNLQSTNPGGRRRGIPCPICKRPQCDRYKLKEHLAIHSVFRKFKCQLCPATFKQKAGLSHHQLVHTKEKRFGCPGCSTAFTYKDTLRTHMKSCVGVVPGAPIRHSTGQILNSNPFCRPTCQVRRPRPAPRPIPSTAVQTTQTFPVIIIALPESSATNLQCSDLLPVNQTFRPRDLEVMTFYRYDEHDFVQNIPNVRPDNVQRHGPDFRSSNLAVDHYNIRAAPAPAHSQNGSSSNWRSNQNLESNGSQSQGFSSHLIRNQLALELAMPDI